MGYREAKIGYLIRIRDVLKLGRACSSRDKEVMPMKNSHERAGVTEDSVR